MGEGAGCGVRGLVECVGRWTHKLKFDDSIIFETGIKHSCSVKSLQV